MSKQVLDAQQMRHLQEMGLELDYDTLYSYVKFDLFLAVMWWLLG